MAKVELKGNADAVEFCPNEPYQHILAAASYTLQEGHDQEAPVRAGELYLFAVEQWQAEANDHSSVVLNHLYHADASGVFDIKWRPYDDGPPCLAQASADGSLSLHILMESDADTSPASGAETPMLRLQEKASTDVFTSMCLYVDWDPLVSNSQVALSHSDGSISIIEVGQSHPEVRVSWQGHEYEAWVVSYDQWKTQTVYSGGDDSQFCSWDLREDSQHLIFRNRKAHEMGVCSIQSNPLWENIVATGSYDEKLRLWDLRMVQKPLMKAQLELGGGVWRLKWHPFDKELILAACMHNGFAIARVGEGDIEILEEYKENKSLAYGASWYRGAWENAPDCRKCISDEDQDVEVTTDELHYSIHGDRSTPGESLLAIPNSGAFQSRDREGVQPRVKVGERTVVNACDEESLSSQLTKINMRPERCMKSLVSTCSFYDKAVHLWLPRTLAFSTR